MARNSVRKRGSGLKLLPAPSLLLLGLFVVLVINPVHATSYIMPVNGRFGSFQIALRIPSSPKWAHDIVLNASLVWNAGQLWFRRTYFPDGKVFRFVESDYPNVTVIFALPTKCEGFAVGWTDYAFAPSSNTIISARTYLSPSLFNASQGGNGTARRYAFALALHELGRVLGLGNVIDSKDIMDPLATKRAAQDPMISTLDLFAVHVLASENVVSSNIVVLNTDQYQLLNAWSLIKDTAGLVSSMDSSARAAVDLYNVPQESINASSMEYHHSSTQHFALTEALVLSTVVFCSTLRFTVFRSKTKMTDQFASKIDG